MIRTPTQLASRWLVLLGTVVCCWFAGPVVASAGAVPTVQWAPPSQLRVVPWPVGSRSDLSATFRSSSEPVELHPKQLLLVPVRSGDVLEIRGARFRVGYGFGATELPDAIVWEGTYDERAQLRVPTWGYARFVAIDGAQVQKVSVRVGVHSSDFLAFQRVDAAVLDYLLDSGPMPALLPGVDRDQVEALRVQGDVLLDGIAESPTARAQLRGSLARWLTARWLIGSYERRALARPYFLPQGVSVGGAAQRLSEGADAGWWEVPAGGALELSAPGADVVSTSIKVWGGQNAQYRLTRGAQVLGEVTRTVPERAQARDRWSAPKLTRVVLTSEAKLQIDVTRGRIRVDVRAYQAQAALFDSASQRSVSGLLASALRGVGELSLGADGDLLRAMMRSDVQADVATLSKLVEHWRSEARPALHAVVSSVLLPRGAEGIPLDEALEVFRVSSGRLAFQPRRALRTWVLEELRRLRSKPALTTARRDELRTAWLVDAPLMTPNQRLTYRALVEALFPPGDEGRSKTTHELEMRAAAAPERDDWRRLARASWRRVTPWTTLEADAETPGALQWKTPLPDEPNDHECEFVGATGLRWSVLTGTPRRFAVSPQVGTHVVVPLLNGASPDQNVAPDVAVDVSGERVSILPLTGEPSHVALRRGTHEFAVKGDQHVLARIPADGRSPCGELREARRWYQISGAVRFQLPVGPWPTVASLVVRPDSVPRVGATVRLAAGADRRSAWVAPPATGALEIPVGPDTAELIVSSEQPLLVRLRIRRHRSPTGEATGVVEQPPRPASAVDDVDDDPSTRLARLRELTRRLRVAGTTADVDRVRSERARLLFAMGQPTLARLDVARRSPEASPVEPRLLPVGERWWPHRSERALAVGRASRLPPLRDDASPGVIRHVAEQMDLQRPDVALTTLQGQTRVGVPGRTSALSALLLERAGRNAEAAAIYEEIAAQTHDLEALTAAVECRTRQAADESNLRVTLQAHLLARRAVDGGARAAPLLAPLWGTVDWTSPSPSTLGKGVAVVDVLGTPLESLSDNDAVAAALTDMPDRARLFSRPARVSLRNLVGKRLALSYVCLSKVEGDEECAVSVAIDGADVLCSSLASRDPHAKEGEDRGERAALPSALGPALTRICELTVPDGARRLTVAASGEQDHLGWLAVSELTDSGWQAVPARVRYGRVAMDASASLTVRGPTLLRVRARAAGEARSTLIISIGDEPRQSVISRRALPQQRDLQARHLRTLGEPRLEVEQIVPIERPGVQVVTFSVAGGDALIRPALATVVTPPHFDEEQAPEQPPLVKVRVSPWNGYRFSRPHEPMSPAPVTLSAELALVDRDLQESDDDAQDRHAQLGVYLRKAIVSRRLWSRAGALLRTRDGPSSFGVDAAASLSAVGLVPGAFARARVMFQPADGGLGFGYRAAVGAYERYEWSPRLAVLYGPVLSVRGVDARLARTAGADNDVYSRYAQEHPYSVDVEATLVHRPYFDTLGRYGMTARLNPGLTEIDRIEVTSSTDWLGGEGLVPWVSWRTVVGYRPSNSFRADWFLRCWTAPEATWWMWLDSGDRLRGTVQLGAHVDVPVRDPALSWFGMLGLGYDFLGAAGLEDFSLSERPHRQRLEEGSRRIVTEAPRSEPLWSEGK